MLLIYITYDDDIRAPSSSYLIVYIGGILDKLFPSNHNIHKSSFGLCFLASDPLLDRFY